MELITAITLLVLAFASYRITRFIVFDDLFDGTRSKFKSWLLTKPWRGYVKLYELISCTFCVGIWVSAALYWLYLQDFELSVETFINVAAIAGAQSLLHVLEPDE